MGRYLLRRLAEPDVSAKVRDIDEADAILVLGTDPLHSSPILDLAAAFRLPVLRSDRVEGAGFRDGVHGVTVAFGSVEALRDALSDLTAEPSPLPDLRGALAREESVAAAIRRLSGSHVRMYADARAAMAASSRKGRTLPEAFAISASGCAVMSSPRSDSGTSRRWPPGCPPASTPAPRASTRSPPASPPPPPRRTPLQPQFLPSTDR